MINKLIGFIIFSQLFGFSMQLSAEESQENRRIAISIISVCSISKQGIKYENMKEKIPKSEVLSFLKNYHKDKKVNWKKAINLAKSYEKSSVEECLNNKNKAEWAWEKYTYIDYCLPTYAINKNNTWSNNYEKGLITNSTVKIFTPASSGTGVIIGKDKNEYLIITAKHVVKDIFKSDEVYLKTADKKEYLIDQDTIKLSDDYDLAILKFKSNLIYPIQFLDKAISANNINDDRNINNSIDQEILVAGYPLPTGSVSNPKIRISNGVFVDYIDKSQEDNKYDLLYSNITLPGMSGGPVIKSFEINKNHMDQSALKSNLMIGIHGQGEIINTGSGFYKSGYNLGISSNKIIEFLLEIYPNFNRDYILKNFKKGEYIVYGETNLPELKTAPNIFGFADGYKSYQCIKLQDHLFLADNPKQTLYKIKIESHIKNGLLVSFYNYDEFLGWDHPNPPLGYNGPLENIKCYLGGTEESINLAKINGWSKTESFMQDHTTLNCDISPRFKTNNFGDPLSLSLTNSILNLPAIYLNDIQICGYKGHWSVNQISKCDRKAFSIDK